MVTITEPYTDCEIRKIYEIMKSCVTNTALESTENKYLNDDIHNSIGVQDRELEDCQEIDIVDYSEVDYYSSEGNYYYYLEVEEG